jgi:hypothetical protein
MPLPGCPSPVEANGECFCSADGSVVEGDGAGGEEGGEATVGSDAVAPVDSGTSGVDAPSIQDTGSTSASEGGG